MLLHSLGLTHREFEPVVDTLADRFRVILPDLPLHGDSEDRPRHPYSPQWLTEVVAAFVAEAAGPRAMLGGHDLGAELALRATAQGLLSPTRLVLMSSRLHRREGHAGTRAVWRAACRLAALPVMDVLLSHAATVVFSPAFADRLTVQHDPAARDLLRHALDGVGGNGNRARSWSKFARRWPGEAQRDLLDAYHRVSCPVLLLWALDDPGHPLQTAQEALDLLPDAQLRTLPATGFLIAYDDAVGVARELIAFCG